MVDMYEIRTKFGEEDFKSFFLVSGGKYDGVYEMHDFTVSKVDNNDLEGRTISSFDKMEGMHFKRMFPEVKGAFKRSR